MKPLTINGDTISELFNIEWHNDVWLIQLENQHPFLYDISNERLTNSLTHEPVQLEDWFHYS